MPHVGVGQPARSRIAQQLTWPYRNDALRVCMALQQIERIELKRSVEEQFYVVEQQQVARGMLISQLTQDCRGLQVALSLWHARETHTQLSSDIQWRDALALGEGVEQCCLSRIRRPDEQDELAVEAANLANETL
jgi:hypothetical protein